MSFDAFSRSLKEALEASVGKGSRMFECPVPKMRLEASKIMRKELDQISSGKTINVI